MLNQLPHSRERHFVGSPHARPSNSSLDTLFDYWIILRARWRLVVTITALAFLWMFIASKFLLTKWYQATAVIRATPPQSELSQMSSVASQVLGGGIGGLLSAAGLDSQIQNEAEFDMSILQSYSFTIELLKRHALAKQIGSESGGIFRDGTLTSWDLYKVMDSRFDCSFDLDTGNLTLTFLAPSREEAKRILNFYIDDLRQVLRAQQVRSAESAVTSLRSQAERTADSVLQADLYQLLAQQLQRQELAEVQADFAFSVIDPPFVGDKPFKPRVLRNTILATGLAFTGCIAALIILMNLSESWNRYKANVGTRAVYDRGNDGTKQLDASIEDE